jgi:hypothetical protein
LAFGDEFFHFEQAQIDAVENPSQAQGEKKSMTRDLQRPDSLHGKFLAASAVRATSSTPAKCKCAYVRDGYPDVAPGF